MKDSPAGGRRSKAAEELILRMIAAHAESLLRVARRYSLCADDAQDAYQRTIELFMSRAHRLDPGRAPGWLHVVVKREAQALRSARQELLTATAPNLDGHEASELPTPEEQLLRFDMVSRSAEALKRLKPQELRALWLRAEGHSYSDIGAITGWSYTKVNRCLTEGRRSFLARYEGIESGAECARWLPVISAMADGEAAPEQVVELRPHLRNCSACRATLRALQDSSRPLAALFPVPLAVADPGAGEDVANLLVRAYEALAGGMHERAIHGATKAQMLLEASASGKVAAMAASAAAVAGGGYATVERTVEAPAASRSATRAAAQPPPAPRAAAKPRAASWAAPRIGAAKTTPAARSGQAVRSPAKTTPTLRTASSFQAQQQVATTRRPAAFTQQASAASAPAGAVRAASAKASTFVARGSGFAP